METPKFLSLHPCFGVIHSGPLDIITYSGPLLDSSFVFCLAITVLRLRVA